MINLKTRILIVEDEALVAEDLQMRLNRLGYEVVGIVDRAEEVAKSVNEGTPNLILFDIKLKGRMTGIEAAEQLKDYWNVPFVFVTSHADQSTLERALTTRPYGYVLKPFDDRGLQAAIRTALERHKVEDQLGVTQSWLNTVLNSIDDAVIVTDEEQNITYVNRRGEQLTSWTDGSAIGQPFSEVVRLVAGDADTPIPNPVTRAIAEQRVIEVERGTRMIARDGTLRSIQDSISPLKADGPDTSDVSGTVIVMHDCSEEVRLMQLNERLRDQLLEVRQLQRMSDLMRSVAHDFNNLLTAAVGGVQACLAYDLDAEETQTTLRTVDSALASAGQLCRKLRDTSVPELLQLDSVDMEELLRDAIDLARMSSTNAVEFEVELSPVQPIRVDRIQIQRVLMNLLVNAIEASTTDSAPIRVTTTTLPGDWLSAESEVLSPAARTLEHACVEIQDFGHGMDDTTKQQIFEPLYSSKQDTVGRGLGLAGVMIILRAHGAGLGLTSAPGQGTTFRILLPLA